MNSTTLGSTARKKDGKCWQRRERLSGISKLSGTENEHSLFKAGRAKETLRDDYPTCPSWYGFYSVTTIIEHTEKCCPQKGYNAKPIKLVFAALANRSDDNKIDKVLSSMAADKITEIVKDDDVIKKLGSHIYEARILERAWRVFQDATLGPTVINQP